MKHFTCDLCRQPVEESSRHTVAIEVQAVRPEPALTAEDLFEDNLQMLSNLLDKEQGELETVEAPPARETFEYDLCPGCRLHYGRDPLGLFRRPRLKFSKN